MFKEIKGYESLYEVSEEGVIRSLDRYNIDKNSKKKFYPGRILRQSLMHRFHTSYAAVTLSKEGTPKRLSVHRIVASTFLGNVEGKDIVNHLDNNGLNNHYKNLEWTDHKGNMQHAQDQGRLFNAQSSGGKIGGKVSSEKANLISDRYIGLTINNWKILSYDLSKIKKYVKAECLLCNNVYSVYLSTITTDMSKQCVTCATTAANKIKRENKIISSIGLICNNIKVLSYSHTRECDDNAIMKVQCIDCGEMSFKPLNKLINKTAKCNLPSGRKKI